MPSKHLIQLNIIASLSVFRLFKILKFLFTKNEQKMRTLTAAILYTGLLNPRFLSTVSKFGIDSNSALCVVILVQA